MIGWTRVFFGMKRSSWLHSLSKRVTLNDVPKKFILSGPSGFLGKRVLKSIIDFQHFRREHGLEPGELVLLSASPGNLMNRLSKQYPESMSSIRASRVDYFAQHEVDMWIDHLGSLGLGGKDCVFINLAATAGPVDGVPEAMESTNYHAPIAAAKACKELNFGHFIQSSTQATNIERAGQVPYSRWKAMCDHALVRLSDQSYSDITNGIGNIVFPVSIARFGLLYCRIEKMLGQGRDDKVNIKNRRGTYGGTSINLSDLSLLPLTPIMGNGSAPLQPLEVVDAARRLTYLAMIPPENRPPDMQANTNTNFNNFNSINNNGNDNDNDNVRIYDAVGPETLSILELLKKFAIYQGSPKLKPIFIKYRNMERLVNVKSLGNLNRQFISILRSEQDGVGVQGRTNADPTVWSSLMSQSDNRNEVDFRNQVRSVNHRSNGNGSIPCGSKRRTDGSIRHDIGGLMTLDTAFGVFEGSLQPSDVNSNTNQEKRTFPYMRLLEHIVRNPGVIQPGIKLGIEILTQWCKQSRRPPESQSSSHSSVTKLMK